MNKFNGTLKILNIPIAKQVPNTGDNIILQAFLILKIATNTPNNTTNIIGNIFKHNSLKYFNSRVISFETLIKLIPSTIGKSMSLASNNTTKAVFSSKKNLFIILESFVLKSIYSTFFADFFKFSLCSLVKNFA